MNVRRTGLDRRAADAVESVTAGDHVAVEAVLLAVVLEADVRLVALEAVHAHVVHVEEQRQAVLDPRRDQVLDDLGLTVDHDVAPAGQLVHRHVVPLAVELEVYAAVDDRLGVQPLRDTGPLEQVDGSLLEHSGPDARLDVLPAAVLEHDGLDPGAMQQRREDEPGRTGADDRDMRA